jgi:YfiH family protein
MEVWKDNPRIFAAFYNRHISMDEISKQIATQSIVSLKQIHSSKVITIESNPKTGEEGDALVTTKANLALTIHTADCVPLLAFGEKAIGACHGGWRGIAGGIIENFVARLGALGEKKENLNIAMGPSIGPCHFEVGLDVAEKLIASVPKNLLGKILRTHTNPKKKFIDLKELCRFKLLKGGLRDENILISQDCTYCDPKTYFSYRRDSDKKGQRLETVIYIK